MYVEGGRKPKKLKRFLSKKNFFVCYFVINLVVAGGFSGVLSYFFHSDEASAAVLNVEILSDIHTVNNSGTTSSQRWQATAANQPVNFTISGAGLADVSANLVGKKYGVLVIPPELANKVKANGSSQVHTNITVDLSKVGVLTATLTAVNDLVSLIDRIQKGLVADLTGVSLNLGEVNKQLALLDALKNFGAADFQQSMTLSADGRAIYFSLDDGIGPILAQNLSTILTNLSSAVSALQVTGTGLIGAASAITINAALGLLKPTLVNAITTVKPLLAVGGTGVQQLADASVLGSTTIQMPTLVSGPGSITGNLDAKFVGTVIKSSIIDIDLLSTANGLSYIYFAGETFAMNNTLLPDSLNFGVHPIQTKLDELFTATQGGVAGAAQTTGTVSVTDTRSTVKNWQIKVAQSNQWNSSGVELSTPVLRIYGGTLTTDYSTGVRSISGQNIELINGSQQELMAVSGVTASGTTSLALPKFDLFVPKNTAKKIGQYETTLIWTVTESP
ncbi:adhesive domain-containing protein [Enterococcus sp. BWR-S5]|uniref:adhesive domain-containing protein n=1 Tax=Enterococcus sp. BWR-S5 TaxID=2787714 RepID=UPI00192125C7|nr:WxL domain-containing protein [Enterococcus sp. BWR-S5]